MMRVIDATPPADFPAQVIILDRELGRRNPTKAFYLRVATPGGVDTVDLDGAITLIEARKVAATKGYEPTHWMETGDPAPWRF